MKVLQVLYSGLGGHGSVAFSLIEADLKREWDTSLVFVGVESLLIDYEEKCKSLGLKYYFLKSKKNQTWKIWLKLLKILFKIKPNRIILHTHQIVPCFIYKLISNAKLIFIEHTPNNVKTHKDWLASRMAMFLANKIVLLTKEFKNELKEKLNKKFKIEKIKIIPNGINVDRFKPAYNPSKKNEVIKAGMAARFTENKLQFLLVEMLRSNKQEFEKMNFVLSLAGDGNQLKNINHLIEKYKLGKIIKLEGTLYEKELELWFQSLNLYIHATKGEALSTSILQAMSCALPIVASDVPGVRNLLGSDNYYGILSPNITKSFYKNIKLVLENQDKLNKMGEGARKLVIKNYSNTEMFKSYSQILK